MKYSISSREIYNTLNKINKLNNDILYKKISETNNTDFICKIEFIMNLLRNVKKLDWKLYDEKDIHDIYAYLNHFYSILHEFLDGTSGNTPDEFEEIVSDDMSKIIDFFSKWIPLFEVMSNKKDEFYEIKNAEIDKLKLNTENKFKTLFNEFETKVQLFEKSMNSLAGIGAVTHFADNFAKAADKNSKNAKKWAGFLLLFSSLTFITSFLFLKYLICNNIELSYSLIVTKAIFVALLASAALWCGKMYKTEKHQQAVNEYKMNALKTFQAFVAATDDPVTKNAILMETTRAIFGNFNPGYLQSEQSASDNYRIFEIFKDTIKK